MIVKTNTGETVDLGQPENVRRGMVFAPKDPRDYCLGEGHIFVVGRRDEANGVWRDARDENLGTNVLGADRLLGCDPAHAERADCERFGIAPGIDAGAHGFARTRDGFAVDFTKTHLPLGAVIRTKNGSTMTCRLHHLLGVLAADDRIIGLNARHASPEDVERLCCGAAGRNDGHGTNPVTGEPITFRAPRCTIAIGHDGEHEDIATGAKWPAKVAPVKEAEDRGCPECHAAEGERCRADCQRVVRYLASRCGSRPVRGQKLGGLHEDFRIATGEERCMNGKDCKGLHSSAELCVEWTDVPKFIDCAVCGRRVEPDGFGGCAMYQARDPERTSGHEWRAGALCSVCDKARDGDLEWSHGRLVPKAKERPGRKEGPTPTLGAVGTTLLYRETIRALLREVQTTSPPPPDGRGVEVSMLLREVREQATVEFGEGFGAASLLPPGALHIHGGGRHWMKLTADGILSCSCGSAKEHADNCDVPAWARADADVGLRVLRDGGTQKEAGAAVVARVERRKREAGLVELVNAVPEGLDPVGWRAAVLALHEQCPDSSATEIRAWLTPQTLAGSGDFACAYRRAVAPHKAPPPERKQRGPRLTVDDGRDE